MLVELLTAGAAVLWLAVLLLPWQPWRTCERFPAKANSPIPLTDVTVVIPARNEADVIGSTLTGLRAQGADLKVIVIDDHCDDGTADAARAAGLKRLTILAAPPLPTGWSGKLWALEQGCRQVTTPYILLLDADILLKPGVVAGLLEKLQREQLQLVSLMARLRMVSGWEKLLMPAFVYFFKLLYPFALANRSGSAVAAAAGGCILLERAALDRIGGLASLHDALIDDCTLATRIKQHGGRIWLGLTHDAISLRCYDTLGVIWQMVARTAYTQLRYSPIWMAGCLLLLTISYIVPVIGLLIGLSQPGPVLGLALLSLAAMALSYWPTLRYYGLSPWRVVSLPVAAVLFGAMTVDSARHHIGGRGARWKQRDYSER